MKGITEVPFPLYQAYRHYTNNRQACAIALHGAYYMYVNGKEHATAMCSDGFVYQYVPVRTSAYQCVPVRTSAYQCVSPVKQVYIIRSRPHLAIHTVWSLLLQRQGWPIIIVHHTSAYLRASDYAQRCTGSRGQLVASYSGILIGFFGTCAAQ